ncbi:MAG: RdgB/HAM1 family non-canonical purine NTP pyrophosphatase [Candidatus Neomarinimicrobiota bacterium]
MFLGIFRRVMFTMSRRRKLILATHNTHKQKEMNALLESLGVNIIGLNEYPQIGDIEETGTTLIENSFIKARAVYKSTGLPSLADDTGLEVDALDGAPGVYSARYAGESASFSDNIKKLLRNLEGVFILNRTARFRTVVTFVDGNRELHSEGIVEGIITTDQKGSGGFGYDPIFLPRGSRSTFSEMTQMEKNKISHRAKALINMKTLLEPYFKKESI